MINIFIISISVIISLIAFSDPRISDKLLFNAYYIKHHKQGWRFFSYAFIHADWIHLAVNMYVLYMFGNLVLAYFKMYFGINAVLYYLLLYIGGVLFAILYDFTKHQHNPNYNAVGASGAVSAIVFASIILHPGGTIYLFFLPFPIPSPVFALLYLVYSAYMSKKAKDNIGHSAHFWGAVFGIVFTIILKPALASSFVQEIFSVFS